MPDSNGRFRGISVTSVPWLKTPEEWMALKRPGYEILDHDGWRGKDAPPWDKPITEREFEARFNRCTIRGPRRDAA